MATKNVHAHLGIRRSSLTVPSEVTHYTDLAGLQGIIEKKELWLSNAAFLNDREELNHGIKQAKKVLATILGRTEDAAAKGRRGLVEGIAKDLDGFLPPEAYITCFCEEQDLLSQWRGYGARQGVSITFETEALVELFEPKGAQLHRVQYGTSAARKHLQSEITSAFPDLIDDFDYLMGDLSDAEIRAKFKDLMTTLVPRFKHLGFSEENEWRLIVIDPLKSKLKFRPRSQLMLPYIILSDDGNQILPITKITIGPGIQDEAVLKSIGFFLSFHGYDYGLVSQSNTPYRS